MEERSQVTLLCHMCGMLPDQYQFSQDTSTCLSDLNLLLLVGVSYCWEEQKQKVDWWWIEENEGEKKGRQLDRNLQTACIPGEGPLAQEMSYLLCFLLLFFLFCFLMCVYMQLNGALFSHCKLYFTFINRHAFWITKIRINLMKE